MLRCCVDAARRVLQPGTCPQTSAPWQTPAGWVQKCSKSDLTDRKRTPDTSDNAPNQQAQDTSTQARVSKVKGATDLENHLRLRTEKMASLQKWMRCAQYVRKPWL
ncbi:hypothetical protein ABBQ38_013027 [Trebouxia sp. C0009 RCD-2024]